MHNPWYFATTSVRNPARLPDGLRAYSKSNIIGKIRRENGGEQDFAKLLASLDLVELKTGSEINSVGRKWRVAMESMGFIYPCIKKVVKGQQFGPCDHITHNGQNLIEAESYTSIQECFLRAMAGLCISKDLRSKCYYEPFHPLQYVLSIMLKLEDLTGSSRISKDEFGYFVQVTSPEDDINQTVQDIIAFRASPEKHKIKLRQRFGLILENIEKEIQEHTLTDYSDANIRYLKITGLVRASGRGIELVPDKMTIIKSLVEQETVPSTPIDCLRELVNGAKLPTDDEYTASIVLKDLVKKANERNVRIPFKTDGLSTIPQINDAIHKLEELLFKDQEQRYADEQANEWGDILDCFNDLAKGRSESYPDMKDNLPAYLEWSVWRAFLAIDSLVNKPNEARHFEIDQNFTPVNFAPGGQEDLRFDFKDFSLVVEVTLSSSVRQEAMEGTPVRNHVANAVQDNKKPVIGLFLATKVDVNTVNTFMNTWYKEGNEMMLDIVPMDIQQFTTVFKNMFSTGFSSIERFRELLTNCLNNREGQKAPAWMEAIDSEIRKFVESNTNMESNAVC